MVHVQIEEGILEGEILDNEYGKPYYSFKGIPYAEPPVGELRFKPPKPVKPWTGVRQAKEFGKTCYQREFFERTPPGGFEDCLYINVYSPNLKPAKPLPVMFWIHGGGYIWGSGNDNMYGPEFLVKHDVILVTFNYRLGILGYLCLDTPDVAGNAGMKDQVLAMKWVQKNIIKFGGDPNNVTIFGESAGATSVSFHLVSPMSKGLFKRAIVQSGSITCFWATVDFHRERAIAFARNLGFYSEDTKELYEFYKQQPIEVFVDLNMRVTQARKLYADLSVAVVSEKDFGNERFFYGDPVEWLRNGIHEGVEVVLGYTEHEGAVGLGFNEFPGDLDKFLSFANNFAEFFVPKKIAMECPLSKQLDLGNKIKKFYIKDVKISKDNIDGLLNFMTMDCFAYDVVTEAKFISKTNKAYLYKFTCKSERNQMTNIFGGGEHVRSESLACHSDDLCYLFPIKLLNQKVDMNSEAFRMIENMTKLWTNFAKYGNPTPDETLGVKWTPYNMDSQNYLEIGSKLIAGSCPDKKDIEFWEQLFMEYLPRCSVYN